MSDTSEQPKRRRHNAELKATIVKRFLTDKVPISDLCDEHGIQPSVVYSWVKLAMDSLPAVFEGSAKQGAGKSAGAERQIALLTARLATKDNVIAEISEEYIALKKANGVL